MMDDNNNNIFEVLESPLSDQSRNESLMNSSKRLSSTRRSHLPLMNAGCGTSSLSPVSNDSCLSNDQQRLKRKVRELQDLGFSNPGPKNLVNVASVPPRRPKTRQATSQDQSNCSSIKPLYDKSGLLLSDQTDRCDCNRLKCPGCFMPCANCQSPKCGLECRSLRTYSYEYRLYGTNKEITQQ